MTHCFHDALPGFDSRQVLHDGCAECEQRGLDLRSAFAHMDDQRFERAWRRAFDLHASAGDDLAVGQVSHAETAILDVLWSVQLRLHERGFPLDGQVPGRPPADVYRERALRALGAS